MLPIPRSHRSGIGGYFASLVWAALSVAIASHSESAGGTTSSAAQNNPPAHPNTTRIAQDVSPSSPQVADDVYRWLFRIRQSQHRPPRWPVAVDSPDQVESNLYSGEAGIFLFLDRYAAISANPEAAALASELGQSLVIRLRHVDLNAELGLYTGATGLAFALLKSQANDSVHLYTHAVEQTLRVLAERQRTLARQPRTAICWNDSTDIISGTSGIGLFLLAAHARGLGRGRGLELAIAAGDGLIHQAQTTELAQGTTGLKWQMQPDFPREMPNYSHGTAGVCDFLIRLHAACADEQNRAWVENYDSRFEQAAAAGGRYLMQCAEQSQQPSWIPHHIPGGENLFYWGWCHGPTGTAAVFLQLAPSLPNDTASTLARQAAERLLAAEPSAQRSAGFWDNPGLCCGSAGVGVFFLNQYIATRDDRYLAEAKRIAADLERRALHATDAEGRSECSWATAEHRVRPEFRQTQTGLMQGAAGIGLFFLQLDAVERGSPRFDVFEDLLH